MSSSYVVRSHMFSGTVTEKRLLEEWHFITRFRWGRPDASETFDFEAMRLEAAALPDRTSILDMLPKFENELKLISAAGHQQFTNYTSFFKELLDYVFVEDAAFEVERIAQFPPEEVLGENLALPSPVFPSDHIVVAVDLRFK